MSIGGRDTVCAMSETVPSLETLLAEAGLLAKADKVDDHMFRLQWGSAVVLVGTSGSAVVALAPLFKELPTGKELALYRKLLEHNAYMGGMACFAIQPDGWVVLHAGRALKGIDPQELAVMVSGVGRFADDFDDQLIAEFFAPPRPEVDAQVGTAEA
jgi:hypothetical protein